MKKLCLFFMLFALLPAMSKSQFVSTDTTTQETYEEVATHIFQQFDFSPLETGFFDEWGAPFAKLEWYNGQLTEENIIDYYAWWRIYTKLSLSKVNENAYPLLEENELKDLMETKSNQYENSVPLPIILMEYERFKPSAMEEELIGYNDNESYFEILNEEYYQKDVLFAVSQASYSIQGLNAMFFVDEELIFKNIPHEILDIQIDFGDGNGFRNININENIFVEYEEAGEKEIIYRVELDNSEVLYSHSVINVIAVYPQTFDYSFNITANEAYLGQKASATVYVVYACGNNKLRKPLIVLEGIDHP